MVAKFIENLQKYFCIHIFHVLRYIGSQRQVLVDYLLRYGLLRILIIIIIIVTIICLILGLVLLSIIFFFLLLLLLGRDQILQVLWRLIHTLFLFRTLLQRIKRIDGLIFWRADAGDDCRSRFLGLSVCILPIYKISFNLLLGCLFFAGRLTLRHGISLVRIKLIHKAKIVIFTICGVDSLLTLFLFFFISFWICYFCAHFVF